MCHFKMTHNGIMFNGPQKPYLKLARKSINFYIKYKNIYQSRKRCDPSS